MAGIVGAGQGLTIAITIYGPVLSVTGRLPIGGAFYGLPGSRGRGILRDFEAGGSWRVAAGSITA